MNDFMDKCKTKIDPDFGFEYEERDNTKKRKIKTLDTDLPAIKPPTTPFLRAKKGNSPMTLECMQESDEKRQALAKVIHNAHTFFKIGLNPVRNNIELMERIDFFFEECERTQQLPTLEKMCLCIGYPRETVRHWREGKTNREGWVDSNTMMILNKTRDICHAMDAELASEGKIQPVVYFFRSKNYYGMKDQQDVVITPEIKEVNTEKLIEDAKMLPD